MKKKYIIILMLVLLLFTSGCTKYMQNDKKERIKYETTGQILPSNILCKPTSEKVIDLYEKNKVNISKLPECDEFEINSGEYEGIWTYYSGCPWQVPSYG